VKTGIKHEATGNSKKTKVFGFALGALLLALYMPAAAQQPARIARIGIVTAQSLSAIAVRHAAFLQGLRELGYHEGKTLSSSIDLRGKI
jgi:predicted alpha/beta-fold hydrolase